MLSSFNSGPIFFNNKYQQKCAHALKGQNTEGSITVGVESTEVRIGTMTASGEACFGAVVAKRWVLVLRRIKLWMNCI